MTELLLILIVAELAWIAWHVRWRLGAELEHICRAVSASALAEPSVPDEDEGA